MSTSYIGRTTKVSTNKINTCVQVGVNQLTELPTPIVSKVSYTISVLMQAQATNMKHTAAAMICTNVKLCPR